MKRLFLRSLWSLTSWSALANASNLNITIVNSCEETIWPAKINILSPEHEVGWEVASGAWQTFDLPVQWFGRLWGRQECTDNGQCTTGTCNNATDIGLGCTTAPTLPVTQIELMSNDTGLSYLINLSQGYNLPVEVIPLTQNCPTISCAYDFNTECPSDARNVTKSTETGKTIACWDDAGAVDSLYRERCPGVFVDSGDITQECVEPETAYIINFCPNGTTPAISTPVTTTSSLATETNSPSTSSEASAQSGEEGLSKGAIAGIVVGAFVFLALIVLGCLFLLWRRRKHEQDRDPAGTVDPFVRGDPKEDYTLHVEPFIRAADEKAAARAVPEPLFGQPASSSQPSPVIPGTSSESTDMDLQRLFEDRRFEGQLLTLIAQRMDPPGAHGYEDEFEGSVMPPPTYREERRTS